MPAGSIATGGALPEAALTSAATAQPMASNVIDAARTATGVSALGSRRASPIAASALRESPLAWVLGGACVATAAAAIGYAVTAARLIADLRSGPAI